MTFLWLSILSSTGIYFLFKVREQYHASLSGMIIINYLVATILGAITGSFSAYTKTVLTAQWLPIAGIIGFLFVVMFFLIGLSTNKAGMALTSIATRMSMVFPIFISMFLFDELITMPKLLKITFTLIAVALAIYRKPSKQVKTIYTFLPVILFVGSGSVDSLVKTAQHVFVPENEIRIFSSVLFGTSLVASLFMFFLNKNNFPRFTRHSLIMGIALGIANFGSLYFLMKALNQSGLDSSLVFGINNLSIVCLTLLSGFLIFKERLTKTNWVGISLSLIGIILLTRF